MNHEHAKTVVDEAIVPMRRALWISGWEIDVSYCRLDDGVMGEIDIGLPHQDASIRLDHSKHETDAELLRTLRHELLHLVAAYYEHVRAVAGAHVPDGPAMHAFSMAFYLASEHTVRAFERVLDACGMTPARLITIGRREMGDGESATT